MPRPGMLTRSRANRRIKTPGGRVVVHRSTHYRTSGTCYITGAPLQLSKDAKHGARRRTSRSSKRPNKPYGGVITSKALRRGIIRAVRD